MVLCLLDSSRSFGSMIRSVVWRKLFDMGIIGRLLEIMTSFFIKRSQRVRIEREYSNLVLTENGGPQGSVLTLICWITLINDIFASFDREVRGLFIGDV